MTSVNAPITKFDIIQVFYANPEAVAGSDQVTITSVDLFFKSKPAPNNNMSGYTAPGVTLMMCELTNNVPNITRPVTTTTGAIATSYKSYDEIYSFADASSATRFSFDTASGGVEIATGQSYGLVVIFDDPAYELWTNTAGDALVGTNTASSGSQLVQDGNLYRKNNSGGFTAISNSDLKFKVYVAKYESCEVVSGNTITTNTTFTHASNEYLVLNNVSGAFRAGAWVYKQTANLTGNVAVTKNTNVIVGTGTQFSNQVSLGDRVVVWLNSTRRQVVKVTSIANSTYMTVDEKFNLSNNVTKYFNPPSGYMYNRLNWWVDADGVRQKLMILSNSNANTTSYFQVGDTISQSISPNEPSATIANVTFVSVDRVRPHVKHKLPMGTTVKAHINLADYNLSANTIAWLESNRVQFDFNKTETTDIDKFNGALVSRSLEVFNSSLPTVNNAVERTSMVIDVSFTTTIDNPYVAPRIEPSVDTYTITNLVSNTSSHLATDANSVSYDTEVGNVGNAISRHISTKVSFANNRFAEDIRVFITAYRPPSTDIKVYARLHNSADPDAFDDKAWSPLEYVENGSKYSSSEDGNDLIEYELGLPAYPEIAYSLAGSFSTSNNSTTITATSNPSSNVAAGDLIRLYSPIFPENYMVASVASANSTAIVVNKAITNNNVIGNGFKVDRLKYKNTAFNNVLNDNIARYYGLSNAEYDMFDSMQIKIVLLADTTYKVPKVAQIQAIGVSA